MGVPSGVESIGDRLRRVRLERGLSQRAVAGPGVTYAYISRIELGQRVPSMKALRQLARTLGVTVHFLETGEELPDAQARELKLGEAELSLRLDDDTSAAEATLREVLEEAIKHGDARDVARARIGLGFAAAHRGDHQEAIACLEGVADEPWVSPSTHPDVFATLGHSYACTGRADRGVELLRRAMQDLASRPPVDAPAMVRFATYLSYALSDLGDLDGARAAISDALEHTSAVGDSYSRVRLYWSNARLASVSGDHHTARLSINRAIALLESTEDRAFLGRAHLLSAEFAIYDDDLDDAREHLQAAEAFIGPASELQDRAWLRIEQSLVSSRTGRLPGRSTRRPRRSTSWARTRTRRFAVVLSGRSPRRSRAVGAGSTARAAFTRASALIPPGSKYSGPFLSSWTRAFPADAEAGVN